MQQPKIRRRLEHSMVIISVPGGRKGKWAVII